MSTTVTTTAVPSGVACGPLLYDIPVSDVACAMPFGGNHTDIMSKCCKDADVVSYRSECGLYCLVQGQTAEDLTECLYDNGAKQGTEVFCNVANISTASATGTGSPKLDKTASATVIATGDSNKDDDDKDDDKSSETASGSSAKASNTDSAAPGLVPQSSVSTLGLAIGALLFSATALGAFQI